mgnify:CR=1 FL=1
MKYFRQFFLILAISFAGEILHMVLPLPVPASIYGLVLMLLALVTGIVKIEQVKDTAVFLIEIMPVMFIPAGAGLVESWSALKPICDVYSGSSRTSGLLERSASDYCAGDCHYSTYDDYCYGRDRKSDTECDTKGKGERRK